MSERGHSGYDEFVGRSQNQRLLEQESLILEATELLSRLLESEGITRAELARRLGKSKAYITQLLRGSSNLTLRTLADLGCVLGYRMRLQAQNASSGTWFALTDVPRLYMGPARNLVACWRGRGLETAADHDQPEVSEPEFAISA